MATERRVTAKASGRGVALTLGELRAFVAEMDSSGAAEITPLRATIGWGGARLTSITADVVRFGDPEPGR